MKNLQKIIEIGTYEEFLSKFIQSHQKVMAVLNNFSNEELVSKTSFSWVGGSTLGSYFVSVTSSHYEWASKKIRKFKNSLV